MSMAESILRARIEESLRLLKPCRLDLLPPCTLKALVQALVITESTRQVLRGRMDAVLIEQARKRQNVLPGLERLRILGPAAFFQENHA